MMPLGGEALLDEEENMKLLTKALRKKLPCLYETENMPSCKEMMAQVKFFSPDSNWTWYGIEFDGEDIFFGYVEGLEKEFGYFSLKELEEIRGPLGLRIERDLYFKPTAIRKIREEREALFNKGEI